MAITASQVKELREMTSAGMMDCKKALEEAGGDLKRAGELLREKGLAKAAKKADRAATQGLVKINFAQENSVASIVEINSETDFVAKNDEFIGFVEDVSSLVLEKDPKDLDALLSLDMNGTKVEEALKSKIATIGENLNIRRFERFSDAGCKYVGYVHANGLIGVIVGLKTEAKLDEVMTLGKDIAMQVASMEPKYLRTDDVDDEYKEAEKQVLRQQILNEGKTGDMVEKILEGKLNKSLKELCLLEQKFVKDSSMTVDKYVKSVAKEIGSDIEIVSMLRYKVGEGLEKKEENFAEEVAKQMGK